MKYWSYVSTPRAVRDGRAWGDKRSTKKKKYDRDGQKFKEVTSDSWEGPGSYDPDQKHYCPQGQYVRVTHVYKMVELG